MLILNLCEYLLTSIPYLYDILSILIFKVQATNLNIRLSKAIYSPYTHSRLGILMRRALTNLLYIQQLWQSHILLIWCSPHLPWYLVRPQTGLNSNHTSYLTYVTYSCQLLSTPASVCFHSNDTFLGGRTGVFTGGAMAIRYSYNTYNTPTLPVS